ncbi:MAG: isoprenyl transferase [Pseudomonadota bacterium]
MSSPSKHTPLALAEDAGEVPRHVAIIMDGNGRWAQKRGLPRTMGHRQGVEAVREVVKAARDIGVEYLTLYSFSSENWRRPQAEISELFSLLRYFISRDLAELHENNVRIKVIGERDGVPQDLLELLDESQSLTKDNSAQTLVVAFNYGSRVEITKAVQSVAQRVQSGEIDPGEITENDITNALDTHDIPDPDLLIRTSGEIRLSNFLLWQLAYSEMVFVDCLWPDFMRNEFFAALQHYKVRSRRFGGLSAETGS